MSRETTIQFPDGTTAVVTTHDDGTQTVRGALTYEGGSVGQTHGDLVSRIANIDGEIIDDRIDGATPPEPNEPDPVEPLRAVPFDSPEPPEPSEPDPVEPPESPEPDPHEALEQPSEPDPADAPEPDDQQDSNGGE